MRNTLAANSKVLSITREGNDGVWGQFRDSDGGSLGLEFKITDEPSDVYCGWTMVAASSDTGEFAVTYVAWTAGDAENWRKLRLITSDGIIGPAINVVRTFTEANFSERCGIVWTPEGWVISIRLPASPFPFPAIVRVKHDGTVEPAIGLAADGHDYNGGAIAYGDSLIALVGFVKRMTDPTPGGTWGRVLNSLDLSIRGALINLDSSTVCEDHAITFTGASQFLGQWTHNGLQTTVVIGPNSHEPINIKSDAAYCLAYKKDTALAVIKDVNSALAVRYLDRNGLITKPDLKIADWDGIVPDYHPSICRTQTGWVINAQFGEGLRFFSVPYEIVPPPPTDIEAKLDDIIARLIRIEGFVKQGRIIAPIA